LSIFKNDSGTWYTKALFYETTLADKSTVVFTLKDDDHMGFPSLYRLYMECADPTGYMCATTHLGGWEHWLKLKECDWFREKLERWNEELEVMLRANALARLVKESKNSGSKNYVEINKLLLNRGWVLSDEGKRKRGAPTKQDIKDAAMDIATRNKDLDEDFLRIVPFKKGS